MSGGEKGSREGWGTGGRLLDLGGRGESSS